MIFNSLLHLILFIVRLPIVTVRFVYGSIVYVCFALPKKCGKFVYTKVGKVCEKVKEWKYGKVEENNDVIEDAKAGDQTIVTTNLNLAEIRPPSPSLRRRHISSSSDYSVELFTHMATADKDRNVRVRKDSCPDLYPAQLPGRGGRHSSRLSTVTRPITHSRSHDNLLDSKESEASPYKISRSLEKIADGPEMMKSKISIKITHPTFDLSSPTELISSDILELTADDIDPYFTTSEPQSPTHYPDLDPSLDRFTQVYQFRSDYWYKCLFVHHTLKKGDKVSLVGDFNGWNTSSHIMSSSPEGFSLSVDLMQGRYEYKFYSNGAFLKDIFNPYVSQVFGNSVIYVHTDPNLDHPPREIEHPKLEYSRLNSTFFHFQVRTPPLYGPLKSFGVLERPIYLYLPPNYSNESKRFPVIYAHDGQSLFSSGNYGWHLDGMLDDLWLRGVVMEFILVAVPNGDDIQPGHRVREYCPRNFNQSNAFLEYIVEVVKPFVDTNYRTVPDASHTFTLGSSLGGLFAFYLATTKPKIFSGAICIAPSLWFHDEYDQSAFDFMELTRNMDPMCRLYLDSGRGEEDNFYVTRSMAETLGDLDWIPERDFMYHLDTSEPIEVEDYKTTHHHHLWRERIPAALNFILSPLQD